MFIFIVIGCFLVFLSVSYWGIPFSPSKKKGYLPPHEDQLSDFVKPVYLEKSKKAGVLLIHGFESSPFEMKELGDYLYSLGYSVSIPLLPGHGTTIDDLIKTDFNDWYNHVEKEYLRLKEKCEQVYIIGLSLGGLLTLKIAENYEPAGLITLSAPVFLNRFFGGKWIMTDFRLFFSGLIALFIKKHKIKRKSDQELCPWEGYMHDVALNCVHSIKRSISPIRKNLYKINSPACLIHAINDQTIPVGNIYYIFQSVNSSEKRAFSFHIPDELTSNHVITTHKISKDRVFSTILSFIQDSQKHFLYKPKKLLGFKGKLSHSLLRFTRLFKSQKY